MAAALGGPQGIQKPKKKARKPENWKQNILKSQNVKGIAHIGTHGRPLPARQSDDLICTCNPICKSKLTGPQKQKVFTDYYGLDNHTEQTIYLRGCVKPDQHGKNRYYLNLNELSVPVCQKYFLGIHAIKKSRLRKKVLKKDLPAADGRGKHPNHNQIHVNSLKSVRDFLSGQESRDSHYSQSKNSNRKYLESSTSISSLYRLFLVQNPQLRPNPQNIGQNTATVKFWLFHKIFNFEFNLAFGYPRSDICEVCENLASRKKLATVDAEVENICLLQEDHWYEAGQFYESMKSSKINNLPPNELCICFDYEKNLPLPVTNVTAEYFLSQLWIFNFCIHDLKTGDAKMFVYAENYAKKGSNEVISCLLYYLENFVPYTITVLHIWCDNSFAQNKNRYLIAALNSLCGMRFDQIKMHFPIPGHSRMRCDKDFAMIERQKKRNDKFSFPSDWTTLIRNARIEKPFTIIYVEHPLTDDLCDDGTQIANVFNYKQALDPLLNPASDINTIRQIRMDQHGQLFYTTTTFGTFEKPLKLLKPSVTINNLRNTVVNTGRAYSSYIKVKPAKLANVKKLLDYVSVPDGKIFYETLDLLNVNIVGKMYSR